MDTITLALAKSQVQDTIKGMGALQGAPCVIKDIEETSTEFKVTFLQVDASGTTQTQSIIIPKDSVDGLSRDDIIDCLSTNGFPIPK